MTTRRIVVLVNDLHAGGAERQALLLARELHARDAEVVFAGLSSPGPLEEECRALGIPCVRCELRFPLCLWRMPMYLWRVVRFLRRLRPDTILAYTSVPNLYAALTWRAAGARVFVWNQRSAGLYRPPRSLERLAACRTPAFVANSTTGRAFLCEQLGVAPEKVRIIHNGVQLPAPRETPVGWRERLDVPPGDLAACMIGNVRPPKDHQALLQAWRIVRDAMAERGQHAYLWIVGRPSPDGPGLDQTIASLGMSDDVRLLGYQPDVYGILGEADLGVFSSRSEGLPNGVLECMAFGLAVAATDLPGIRECLPREQVHYLAPAGDVQTLAQAIVALLTDSQEREKLGALNLRRVREHFSVESLVEKTLDVIT